MMTIEKMMKIIELNKEMVNVLMPEKMRGHLDVIGREIKLMIIDSLGDVSDEKRPSVKKVNIE